MSKKLYIRTNVKALILIFLFINILKIDIAARDVSAIEPPGNYQVLGQTNHLFQNLLSADFARFGTNRTTIDKELFNLDYFTAFPAPPTIVCPGNKITANDAGLCNASVSGLAATINDPDGDITTLTWAIAGATTASSPATGINNITTPRTFNVGISTVTYTVTDALGSTASCSFTVTVNDTQLPAITCPANINTTFAEGQCNASVTITAPIPTDNCGIATTTAIRSDGLQLTDPFPAGVTTITWTTTDIHGNSANCTQTVTITDGILLANYNFTGAVAYPVNPTQTATGITCQATSSEPFNVISTLGTATGALAFVDNFIANPAIFMDPSTGTNTRYFQFHLSGDSLYKYRKFKLYVQARRGNRAAQTINFAYSSDPVSFTVNGSLSLLSSGVWYEKVVDWSAVSLINNRNNLYIRLFASNGTGGIGDNRLLIDNFQISGIDGPLARRDNVAIPENTPVTIAVMNNDTYGCNGPAAVTPISITTLPSSGTAVLNGDQTITYTPNPNVNGTDNLVYQICDATGSCDTAVVRFTISPVSYAPSITCPGDISSGSDVGMCAATVNNLEATYFDFDGNITSLTWTMTGANTASSPATGIHNLSNYTFNLGTSTITYIIKDADGLGDTCSFTVTAFDSENPWMVCSADTTITIPACDTITSPVTLEEPGRGDNCGILSLISNAPSQFEPGNTSVIWTVTDVNGNSTQCEQVVTVVNAPPMVLTTSSTDANCGSSNGSATVTVSGGNAPYTYLWATTPPQTTATATNLSAGTYSVTVTDANNCSVTTDATVNTIPGSLAVTISQVNVACYGASTGSATANVTGGVPPYTYAWLTSPIIQTTPTAIGLPAGPLTLAVFDDLGCFVPGFVLITQPADSLTGTITSQVNVGCNGTASGSLTITAQGGTPPYQYSINGGALQFSGTFNNLIAGTYNILVQDANNCTYSLSSTITQPATMLNIAITDQTNVSCNGDLSGSATVTASGGIAPYSYSWNTTPVQTTATALNLGAGTYIVTVTDASGCVKTASATISEPDPLVVTVTKTDVTCYGLNNGTATANVTGGLPPYTYAWLTSPVIQTTQTAINLEPIVITLAVFDSEGCFAPAFVQIDEPASPLTSAIVSQTNVGCTGGNTGSVTVTGVGGTAPYEYNINGGSYQISGIFGSLAPGTYTIGVRDDNGCLFNGLTVTIIGPLSPLSATISSSVNPSCNGDITGSATVTVTGGVTPYTYHWNTTPPQNTPTAVNLGAGTYSVTVTDNTGCNIVVSTTITEPDPVLVTITKTDVTCFGLKNGTATANVTGGYPPYTYAWLTTPVIQTTQTAINLEPGVITLAVFDTAGCFAPAFVQIDEPASALTATLVSQTNIGCTGGNTGSFVVSANGGTAPYQYSINGGTYQSSGTFNALAAGVYNVSVQDTNGCLFNSIVVTILGVSDPLSASISDFTEPECNGDNTGTATVVATGGVTPYTYLWNTVPPQTTATATNMTAGTYTVKVTDFAGCITNVVVTLNQPTPIVIDLTHTDVTCFGANNGTATVVASGGTPPYTYAWLTMPIQTTPTATGLEPSTITLAVFDDLGCFAPGFVTISQPAAPLTATISNQQNIGCTGGNTGSFQVNAAGGTAPYQFSVNGGTYQSSNIFANLAPGTYNVSVRDTNDCQFNSLTVTIVGVSNPLSASITNFAQPDCHGNATGWAVVTANGGIEPYSYSWNTTPVQTTDSAINLAAGNYQVTVTDFTGCVMNVVLPLGEPAALALTIDYTDVTCLGNGNGTATAIVSGGRLPYTYAWLTSPIQTTQTAINLIPGVYTLAVFDSAGCFIPGFVSISEPATAISASVTAQGDVNCLGNPTGWVTVQASGGTPGYQYNMDGGPYQTSGTFLNLMAGAHTVIAMDTNGCTFTVPVFIIGPVSGITATITNLENIKCFGQTNGSVTIVVNTGIPPYLFSLNGGPTQSSGTFSNLAAGNYTVTISDGSPCTLNVLFSITQPAAALTSSTAQHNVSCFSFSDGYATALVSGGTTPYNYSWNTVPIQTNDTAFNLNAGTYIVNITDANNCTTADTVIITQPALPLNGIVVNIINTDCAGNNTGSALIAATGGTPDYQFSIDGGSFQTSGAFNNLPAGSHSVTIQDANNCTVSVDFTISVTGVPVAVNDFYSTTESVSISQNAMANDLGMCFPPVEVSVYSLPANGNLTMNSNGLFTYTPNALFNGTDTFTYTIVDANGADSTAVVTITINAVNDPPVTFNETFTVYYNYPLNDSILANADFDPDGTSLSVSTTPVLDPTHGTILVNPDGTFIYTPNLNYIGPDTAIVAVCDAGTPLPSLCTNDTIFLTVLPPNQPPVTVNEQIALCAEMTFTGTTLNGGTVLNGDADPENNLPLHASALLVSGPQHGSFIVTDSLSGTFNYTPNIGYTGSDQVVVQICDNGFPVECANDTVFIQIHTPEFANAGLGQQLCNADVTFLVGNTPAIGTGSWTMVSGPNNPSIFPPTGSVAVANGLIPSPTPYVFMYSINNSGCITTDSITVINYNPPTQAYAGIDQAYCTTGSITTNLEGNTPVYGTGSWNQIQGPVTALIADTLDPATQISGLTAGTYAFQWTITNGVCQSTGDVVNIFITAPATAYAGPDDSICSESSYAILSATATGYSSLLWMSSGTGTFSDPAVLLPVYYPSATDILNGTVALTLTANGNNPCPVVVDQMVLTINKAPMAFAGNDAIICEAQAYTINDATAQNATSIMWTTTGSGTFINDTTLTPTYTPAANETGTITFILNAIAENGCANASDTLMLTIAQPVAAFAGNDTLICSSSSLLLNGSTAQNQSSVNWLTSGNGVFDDPSLLHPIYTAGTTDIATGTVFLTLVATGNPLCPVVSDSITVAITASPIAFAGPNDSVCNSSNYRFENATAQHATSVLWTTTGLGTITASGTLNPTYHPAANESGNITFVLTAYSTGICDSVTDTVNLYLREATIINGGPDIETCENQAVSISSASASGYSKLHWSTSGNGTFDDASLINPTYTPGSFDIASGIIMLTVSAEGYSPCTTITDQVILTINKPPTVNAGPDFTTCASGGITITQAQADNYSALTWTVTPEGAGTLALSNTLNPILTPTAGFTGIITLTIGAQGTGSCNDKVVLDAMNISITQAIQVDAGPDQYVYTGSSTQLNGSVNGGSGFYGWSWQPQAQLIDPMVENPYTTTLLSDVVFHVTVLDVATGCTATDSVFIHVGSTGTGIAAIADYDTTLVNQPVAIKVTTNDINPSGDPLLVSLCGYPLHGIVEVNTDNSITYTPHNGYQGDDVFCYRICNVLNPGMCSDTMVYVHVKQPSLDDIFVYTGISPNHDDNNDTWVVKGIELYPDNTVQIYNRWGDIIKEFAGYNNLTKVWDGTNESGEIVPDGTYFYIINLKFVGVLKGWIYKQGN